MFHRRARAWLLATLALGFGGVRAQQAPDPTPRPPQGGTASSSSFNPALSLILSGTYANLSRDPDDYRIRGFAAGGEIGPGPRGFNLGESELGVAANIDPYFYGAANISITPENEAEVEEAFVQTTSLGRGMTPKFGRFFSGIGYLNEQHPHTWDFADAPLAYQAFLGGQLNDDGMQVQLARAAPTRSSSSVPRSDAAPTFPAPSATRTASARGAVFVHAGGDIGDSSSWRAGLSYLQTSPQDRLRRHDRLAGNDVTNALLRQEPARGRRLRLEMGAERQPARQNLKLQGEYFIGARAANSTYDTRRRGRHGTTYATSPSGWYVQAVYQFMPRWRIGVRYDRLDTRHRGSTPSNARVSRHRDVRGHRAYALMARLQHQRVRPHPAAARARSRT